MTRKRKESLVYEIGINDADYPVSARDENGKDWRCPFYKTWKNMLARCYSPAFQRNQPLYKGCSVDERWHRFSHFKSWMIEQDWEDKQLDKDRRFDGNQVYGPDTCQFLSRGENVRAQKRAAFAAYKGFWVHLRSFYRDDIAAYIYAYRKVYYEGYTDLEVIEDERKQSNQGILVVWEGVETPLKSICHMYSKEYEVVRDRMKNWKVSTIYSQVFYEENPFVSFELTGKGGVIYQFRSKQELVDYLGIVSTRVDDYLPLCKGSLILLKQLIREHKPKSTDTRTLYTINGISEYKDYWYALYETSEPRVSGTMKRLGISFEEAVQRPIERVSRVLLNGEVHTVKQMWLKFSIDPKKAANIRAIKKLTYRQVLELYGVDTTDITLVAL
jgi:hypothetical protein